MKVILIQDVARLGRRSEIKDVPRGHALNFLIPRKLVIPATSENLKRHKELMSKSESLKAETVQSFQDVLTTLKDQTVTHKAPANEKNHLFSGVGAEAIVEILKEQGHHIDASVIKLEQPIKELGAFTIELEQGDIKGNFTLEIVSDK